MEFNKEIMSRLKFIGKIQKGEKINVKYMYIQPEGFLTTFIRTLVNQCNRQNTLQFVRNTIFKTFDILVELTESRKEHNILMSKNIIEDLKLSKNGLANLKETYISDTKFGCDIETLLHDIDSQLLAIT